MPVTQVDVNVPEKEPVQTLVPEGFDPNAPLDTSLKFPTTTTTTPGTTTDQQSQLDTARSSLLDMQSTLESRESSVADGAVASDTGVIEDENKAQDNITDAEFNDPTTAGLELLDVEIDRINAQLQGEIGSINQTFDTLRETQSGEQEGERGTTSVGLAGAGGYLGFSGSGTGVMLTLAKSHRAELADLAAKRRAAIASAKSAAGDKRMTLVRDKAGEIARIDQEVYDRQQDYQSQMKIESDKERERVADSAIQRDIFNAIETGGSQSAEDIFRQLKGTVPIEEINSFLQNITPEQGEGFSFTPSQNASMIGAGLAIDDIRAISEYVAENGYDDTIKSALTSTQQKTLDKIFGTAVAAGAGLTEFTSQEKRKLEQAGLAEAPRHDQLDYLYGDDEETDLPFESIYTRQILETGTTLDALPFDVQEDVRGELFNLGFGSSVVPLFYKDYIENEMNQTMTKETLEQSWEVYRTKALGEYVPETEGGSPWYNFWD